MTAKYQQDGGDISELGSNFDLSLVLPPSPRTHLGPPVSVRELKGKLP